MPGEEDTQVATQEAPVESPVAKEGEPKPEHMIPKSRFDEVNSRAKQYERFGSPEQIQEMFARNSYFEELQRQAIEEARTSKTGEATPETAQELKDAEEARNALYTKVDPELLEAKKTSKSLKEAREEAQDRRRRIAGYETRDMLREELGEEPTQEQINRRAKQLRVYMEEDRESLDEFWEGDTRRAVRRMEKLRQKDLSSGKRDTPSQETSPTIKLPRSPSPTGGSPPTGKEPAAPASTMRELQKRVDARLARAKDGEI